MFLGVILPIFACFLIIVVINTLVRYKDLIRLRIASANFNLVEQEIDLLERACSDAIHCVNQYSHCCDKVCRNIEPGEKKKMGIEVAQKFAIAYGVSQRHFHLIDDMIESILGSHQPYNNGGDDEDDSGE